MKTRFYLFIGFMLLIVFSCEKDDFLSDALDDPNSIEAVQAWFEASHSEFLSCKISGDKTPQHLKPNWSQITKASNSEYDVIECHVKSQFEFGYIAKEAQKKRKNDSQNSVSVSKLVIATNKATGERESFLMTLISSHDKFENLQQNTYLQKKEDFSGFEILSDAKGSFLKARRYLKGESAGAVRLIYDEAKEYKIPNEHADDFMVAEIYFWQQETADKTVKANTMQASYSFSLASASYYYWWWASEHSKPVKDMVHKVGKNVDTAKLQAAYDELREDCFYRVIDDLFREYEIKLGRIGLNPSLSGESALASVTKSGDMYFVNNTQITAENLKHEWIHLFQKEFSGIDIFNKSYEGVAEFEVALLQDIIGIYEGTKTIKKSALAIRGRIYHQDIYGPTWLISDKYSEIYKDWLSSRVYPDVIFPLHIDDLTFSEFAHYFGLTSAEYGSHRGYYYPIGFGSGSYIINLLLTLFREKGCVNG